MDFNHQIVKLESLDWSLGSAYVRKPMLELLLLISTSFLQGERGLPLEQTSMPALLLIVCTACVCLLDAREVDGIYCSPISIRDVRLLIKAYDHLKDVGM